MKGQGTGKQLWEPGKPYQNHKVVGQDFNDFGDLLAGSAWFSKQGWGTGFQRFWGLACRERMVFKTRLGYRKTISGRIRGTGEGRIYIKVVITPFNVFQWFVTRLTHWTLMYGPLKNIYCVNLCQKRCEAGFYLVFVWQEDFR